MEKKKHPLGWLLAGLISLIIMLPVYIFGNIFNLTFLSIPNLQIPKIKDPQFHSSIRFGLSLALAFIFLPVYLILCLAFILTLVGRVTYFHNTSAFRTHSVELLPAFRKDNGWIQDKETDEEEGQEIHCPAKGL